MFESQNFVFFDKLQIAISVYSNFAHLLKIINPTTILM